MVSILPAERSSWDVIGKQIGANLSQNLPGAIERGYNRGQIQQSLNEIKKMASSPNSNPLDIALAAMQAGAGIPGSERYLSQIIPLLQKNAYARNSQDINYSVNPQKQDLPGFMQQPGQNQKQKFFPENVGAQETSGNVPRASHSEDVIRVLNPDEVIEEGKRIASQERLAGNPTTALEGYEIAKRQNEENRLYNQGIEKQKETRALKQQQYGQKADEALLKVVPDATDEQKAIFRKKAEEYSNENKSEADIERLLAKDVTQFSNQLSNLEKQLSAPRFHTNITRNILGTDKSENQAIVSARTKIKPLLDQGLYDTSRKLLKNTGWYPEERELIINPLNDQTKAQIAQIGKSMGGQSIRAPIFNPHIKTIGKKIGYNNYEKDMLTSSLEDVFNKNPGISPALVRLEYENKGYDWRIFEETMSNLINEKKIQLNPDQQNQFDSVLNSPPLNNLELLLYNLNLQGR
jgi:hypothetical protein